MKLKSIIVIILSSILISSAILLTILGLSFYHGWKEKESVRQHKEGFARLNARIYNQHIDIQHLEAKYEKEGMYKSKCLLEGVIKNNGYRTVSSVNLSIEFLNAAGDIIYVENFFPLKEPIMPRRRTIAALSLFTSGKELPLLPSGSLRFKRVLSEQKNKDLTSPIKYKRYATNSGEWSGKFNHRVVGIKF